MNASENIEQILNKVGCTSAQECIGLTQSGFAKKLGVPQQQAGKKWQAICRNVFPISEAFVPLNELNSQSRFLTVGDPQIDLCLGGGIRTGMLTEIVGESSAGKTQFCLQLCLTAQLPFELGGLDGDAAYISTEEKFPIKRVANLIPELYKKLGVPNFVTDEHNSELSGDFGAQTKHALQRVHTRLYINKDQFIFAILHQISEFVEKNNIKLLVVDSIAGMMRFQNELSSSSTGNDKSWVFERDKLLFLVSAELKRIASKFSCAVVCVNQVADKFMDGSELSNDTFNEKVPALGKQWSSMINARIFLRLKRGGSYSIVDHTERGEIGHLSKSRRWVEAMGIPWAYPRKCEFEILNYGLQSVKFS